jgi:FlaA1/EpsC-like NDP-sugar epimerase
MGFKELILKSRRLIIVLVHLVLVVSAYALAFYLRLDYRADASTWQEIFKTLPVIILVKMSFLVYYRLFSGLWRYAGIDDIWRIAKANFLSTLCIIPLIAFFYGFEGFPRSIFAIDCILSFGFMSGIRFATRFLRERFRPVAAVKQKRIVIMGAGEAGVMVLRELRNNPRAGNIEITGFIDDDPRKKSSRIQGVSILGGSEETPLIVEKYGIDEIVIAIPSAKGEVIRKIVSRCRNSSAKIRIAPELQRILSGELEIKPREIKPEDLLGRKTVNINRQEINDYLSGKVVMVTGAGGSIGSALCRQIVMFGPKEILLFDHNENNVYFLGAEFAAKYPLVKFKTIIGDIKDIGLLKNVFSRYRPQVVFHAAAHKHVPLMEENPAAAVKNNIVGTRNLIYASDHYKVERFILISTDKAVNPTSVMGISKRIAEMILQAKARISKTRFMAVRFGNVLGSDGSVVPLFKKQIEEGGPVTLTHPEVKRYFMSVSEAAQLVLQTGVLGKAGEIFILDMGEQIKILDLAKEMIVLYGLSPEEDIKIKFIGLRPGEKLFEETLLDSERDKATKADKIYIAQSNHFDPRVLRKKIKELERMAGVMDERAIVKKLREVISI